jgi:menaquinol-cytochrome c reductase iron-sulfur subunit
VSKEKISRRRFLTYTLGGTAGFLGAGMIFPMIRFAVDPVLKQETGGQFIDVSLPVSEITSTPKAVKFTVQRRDGWYVPAQGVPMTAWVLRNENNQIIALSPICKHLGCTVNWNSNPQYKEMFFCPCHFGLYTKDGINVPGTPPPKPLDHYLTKEENGRLLIGPIQKS